MRNTMKVISMSIPIIFFLSSCGGGGSSSGGGGTKEATWTLDPNSGASCPTADRIGRSDNLTNCQWDCAVYKGETGIVSITFRKKDGQWELLKETVITPCAS